MSEGGFHHDPESLLAHSTWVQGVVRALVFDPSAPGGFPIKAAEVFIGGWRNPFGRDKGEVALELRGGRVIRTGLDKIHALDLESMLREDLMCGCLVATDESGGFEVHLPGATRAWIQPARAVGVLQEEYVVQLHEPPWARASEIVHVSAGADGPGSEISIQ